MVVEESDHESHEVVEQQGGDEENQKQKPRRHIRFGAIQTAAPHLLGSEERRTAPSCHLFMLMMVVDVRCCAATVPGDPRERSLAVLFTVLLGRVLLVPNPKAACVSLSNLSSRRPRAHPPNCLVVFDRYFLLRLFVISPAGYCSTSATRTTPGPEPVPSCAATTASAAAVEKETQSGSVLAGTGTEETSLGRGKILCSLHSLMN
mmetsp:Transcript_13820/g.34060  ORF Transcript_13820/g.34060 Transcript_13820/m.34060 type:complete len:205 (+) Transcript_13820:1243-1857(+)